VTSPRTPLIVPSETQIREFDGKLLLACVAAERGFPVIVGSRIAIHNAIHRLPRGTYLAKDVKQASRRMIRIITGLGNRVVSLDEEGAVVASREHYWETRIDRETVERVSAQLAWGEEEAETLSRYPHHHGAPIHVTGNPRTDLMRRELRSFFDAEVASIQRRFGRPILINTNFGVINPYFPSLLKYSSAARSAKNPTPHFTMSGLVRHRHQIFEHFKKLVPDLADAFPEVQILVRPHPGENHDVWRECAARHDNAHVVFEGSVTPWLFACTALIHNGCTTAVEAAVQEAPAICWQPVVSEALEIELPNALSRCISTLPELCEALRGPRPGGPRQARTAGAPHRCPRRAPGRGAGGRRLGADRRGARNSAPTAARQRGSAAAPSPPPGRGEAADLPGPGQQARHPVRAASLPRADAPGGGGTHRPAGRRPGALRGGRRARPGPRHLRDPGLSSPQTPGSEASRTRATTIPTAMRSSRGRSS
jgi:surface carbohydrate biosynthesis protein